MKAINALQSIPPPEGRPARLAELEGALSDAEPRCKQGLHLLECVGVQEQNIVILAANEVQGAARTSSHNAGTLGEGEDFLELWDVACIQGLQISCRGISYKVVHAKSLKCKDQANSQALPSMQILHLCEAWPATMH